MLICDGRRSTCPYRSAPGVFKRNGFFRHLSATDLGELRAYAREIGLKGAWEQVSHGGIVHYDVTGRFLDRVDVDVQRGRVREMSSREFIANATSNSV